MNKDGLSKTAKELVAEGKGLLAADWSFPTIEKHFRAVGVESTEENRRIYRELLFTTPDIEKYISGVILFDEAVYQRTENGVAFPQLLSERGIIPGIKVDQGKEPLKSSPKEMITKGIETLAERLSKYVNENLKFTKWRGVFSIGKNLPSSELVEKNSKLLAKFATLSQEAGLVPVVEPEVLMDGDHDISRCEEVTRLVLASVFSELEKEKVYLQGMLLKPNMVVPGKDSPKKASPGMVAEATLRALTKTVPDEVPGIVFLSGGQSPEEATANLNAMNQIDNVPWELSFSFARALQKPALMLWKGRRENVTMAQEAFYKRAKLSSLARYGKYTPALEKKE